MAKKNDNQIVSNRRAFHDYEILESFEAGIALQGTEIKSLRDNGGSLQDAFVDIEKSEAFLKNATIAHYKYGNIHNHQEKRDRKLLLHKREIDKLKKAVSEKGLTIIPTGMYLSSKGYVKVKIALARGKKLHDKRQSIKDKEQKRSIEKMIKEKM